eukprot:scaffold1774_cov200-Alexandrium_tamarense.AAC.3
MVSVFLTAAITAALPLSTLAFAPSHHSPIVRQPSSSWTPLYASGKGFGEKPAPTKPQAPPPPPSTATSSEDSSSPPPQKNEGSTLLKQLRTREAEQRDAELQKLRDLRATDSLLKEDPNAAAIPEKVAQRMGKRMLPFVGVPLFGTFATFIGFWYAAVYKDMEFQPAIVASTSFVFLAIGLLVSMDV